MSGYIYVYSIGTNNHHRALNQVHCAEVQTLKSKRFNLEARYYFLKHRYWKIIEYNTNTYVPVIWSYTTHFILGKNGL